MCGKAGMNQFLGRVASFAARWHWLVIIAWIVILGGLVAAHNAWGGTYVNNYNVSGTDSDNGLNRLNSHYSAQGGYGGQIVFHARHGTVTADSSAVNQATSNVAKLPHVIKATSPFASSNTGAVSKDGTIAYTSVSWSVNPNSLGTGYLNRLNKAVDPATKAGLSVDYGAGAGQIGQTTSDKTSEAIGLGCALILLIFMFGSLITAAMPLISALFSVGAGLSALGLLASAITFPTTAPTIATLLGLGVAVDYGLFLVSRHREQLDTGMDVVSSAVASEETSGAAVVVAGSTVVLSILGL
jgi:putative drug exporter of the RND superfamily